MAKAMLFLLAFVLLVSTQVTSTEEEISTDHHEEHHHVHHHPHHHVHHHPHHPGHALEDSSIKAQIYPSKGAPAYAPETSRHHDHGDCVTLCDGEKGYCRSKNHGKRECERACVPCCDQYNCVPEAYKKCSWDKVWYDNKWVKCP